MMEMKRAPLWAVLALALWSGACDSGGEGEEPGGNNGQGGGCQTDFDCLSGTFCVEGACAAPGTECGDNADCGAEEMCAVGYCVPRVGECEGDEGCDEGEICDEELRCRAGCREDVDCGEGRQCDEALLRCVTARPECPESCPAHQRCNEDLGACEPDGTCATDNDCEGALVCLEGACGEDPMLCARNQDCPAGTFCDTGAGMCRPGCRQANECEVNEICLEGVCTAQIPDCDPDAQEPNDSQEAATPLSPSQALTGLTICDDVDWYSFVAFEGDEFEVRADFMNDSGNLNLRFYAPDGDLLQLLGGQGDGERLRRTVSASGTYLLEVFGAGRGTYNSYDLSLSVTRNCAADSDEENDTAQEPTVLEGAAVTRSARSLCEEDEDWYLVALYPGEAMDARIDFTHVAGDLSLELYDSAGGLLEAAQTDADQEVVALTADARRDVLLRVPGAEGLINLYDLSVSITPGACEDDGDGDNDSPMGAASAQPGSSLQGQICVGDEDWFRVSLPAEVSLRATLEAPVARGELSLALVRPDGEEIEAAFAGDEAVVDVQTALPGDWLLRVRGRGRAQNAYTLRLEGGPEAACPQDDRLEQGEGFADPVSLAPGGYGDLLLCGAPSEEDWFSVALSEGESLEVFALAGAADGEVSVALYAPDAADADAAPFDLREGPGEIKRVRAQLGSPPGLWRVRVRGAADARYALRVSRYEGRLPLDCEFDDEFEPNGLPAQATRGVSGAVEAIACDQDADWYRFEAREGDAVSVRVEPGAGEGALAVALFVGRDVQEPALAPDPSAEEQSLRWRTDRDGPLFVRVQRPRDSDGEGRRYHLTVSALSNGPALDCALDDDNEPNNDFEAATPGAPGRRHLGIACGVDEDWFGLSLGAGEVLRVWMLAGGDEVPSLALLGAAGGDPLAEAETHPSSARTLRYEAQEAAQMGLRVQGVEGGESPYALWWSIEAPIPEACQGQEPDLDDDPQQALVIEEAGAQTGLSLCGADEDWRLLEVPARQGVIIEADFDGLQGDLQLEVYDLEGAGVAASYGGGDRERVVLERGDRPQGLLVRTFLAEAAAQALSYELTVTYDENLGACLEDTFEPNQNSTQARTIQPGTLEAVYCQGNDDWFEVMVDFLEILTIELTFDGQAADLDMVATALFEGELGRSTGVGDQERLVVEPLVPGPVWIRIYAAGEGEASYTLRTSVR